MGRIRLTAAGAAALALLVASAPRAGSTASGPPTSESGEQGDPATQHLEAARRARAAGDTKRALELYQAVLNLRGDDPDVRQQLAEIRLADGQVEEARAEAQRAVDLAPKRGRYRLTLALTWSRGLTPDGKKAKAILKAAIRLLEADRDRPGLADGWYALGRLAEDLDHDFESARDDYRIALEYNPADSRIRSALGRLAPEDAGSR